MIMLLMSFRGSKCNKRDEVEDGGQYEARTSVTDRIKVSIHGLYSVLQDYTNIFRF